MPVMDTPNQNAGPGYIMARKAREPPVHRMKETTCSMKALISLFFLADRQMSIKNRLSSSAMAGMATKSV